MFVRTFPEHFSDCAVLLQSLQHIPHHFGYTALFGLTVIYLVLGTIVIRKVKGVR